MAWIPRYWSLAALAGIVAGAGLLSLHWVYLVPIFQSPDETLHWDYAICLKQHGRLFRASAPSQLRADARLQNYYGSHFRYFGYFLHPYTRYLADRCEHASITFNSAAKVPPGYGTPDFFRALDRDKPPCEHLNFEVAPALAQLYPFGYYALLAGWLELWQQFTDDIGGLFFGARILSVVLLMINLALGYAALRELRLPAWLGLALTASVGFFPLTSFMSSYIQADNLAATLVTACCYCTFRCRRRPASLSSHSLLGIALGALLVTKHHFFVCMLVPCIGTLVAERIHRRQTEMTWMCWATLLAGPTVLLAALDLWSSWEAGVNPIATASEQHPIWDPFVQAVKAVWDFYFRQSHRSFWGEFGWLDARLRIGNRFTHAVIAGAIHVASALILGLTIARLSQVSRRLIILLRSGRQTTAIRMMLWNPAINSYFFFTAVMIALYAVTRNGFGAQGRNWFPFLMPTFLTAIVYAPRAIRSRRAQAALLFLTLGGLLTYDAIGGWYAIETIRERYYPIGYDLPFREVSIPVEPSSVREMSWQEGAGKGVNVNAALTFRLQKPQRVRGLRLRYQLSNAACDAAPFTVSWQNSQAPDSHAEERRIAYLVRTPPEECSMTIWINDNIDEFTLQPDDKPFHFQIKRITLVLDP
jgi:hypothetical protein